jgi:glycosyltransferase EpsF
MKVLTVISKLEMGGIEKTLLSCMPYFKKEGIEMHILCTIGGELDSEFIAQGATLIDFGSFKKPFLDAFKLYRVLKKEKYDIIHSRYGHTSGVFAKIGQLLTIPILVSVHNEKAMFMLNYANKPFLSTLRHHYLNFHKRWTIKFATKIIGHSQANLKYFTNNWNSNTSKYEVVYNGVDFSKFKKEPIADTDKSSKLKVFVKDASKVFIHIGSFKEQKNHDFLIQSFNELKPVENNYKLLLLGTGPLKNKIEEEVNKIKLENQIYFVGVETNIEPYLAVSNIFFFPSLYEGFGNVLIEAQYMKLPIVASGIPPHYEAVFSGYHNLFFNPDAILAAVKQLKKSIELIDSNQMDDNIQNAFEFAKYFSIENMTKNLIMIYNKTKQDAI